MNKKFSILLIFLLSTSFIYNLQANTLHVIHTVNNGPKVIDLGPTVYKREKGVKGFMSALGNASKESEDKKQIETILAEYQKNRKDPSAWQDAQIKLQLSDISPDKKAEIQHFMNSIR